MMRNFTLTLPFYCCDNNGELGIRNNLSSIVPIFQPRCTPIILDDSIMLINKIYCIAQTRGADLYDVIHTSRTAHSGRVIQSVYCRQCWAAAIVVGSLPEDMASRMMSFAAAVVAVVALVVVYRENVNYAPPEPEIMDDHVWWASGRRPSTDENFDVRPFRINISSGVRDECTLIN